MQGCIQDWLKKVEFIEDQAHGRFYRVQRYTGDATYVPFGELSKHTLDSFKNKALAKGWVSVEETKK